MLRDNRNRPVTSTASGTQTMRFQRRRAFQIGGASWLALCAIGNGAVAQNAPAPSSSTQLPEVTVTEPSPIVRRPIVRSPTPTRVVRASPGANRERAPQAPPAPVAPAPQQGVLPVVTDQFATVTVVPNEEIRRQGTAQLGDLLFSKPGRTVPDLRTACQGPTRNRRIGSLCGGRNPNGYQFRGSRRGWRYPDRHGRRQLRVPRRRLWPQGHRLQRPELSLSLRYHQAIQR